MNLNTFKANHWQDIYDCNGTPNEIMTIENKPTEKQFDKNEVILIFAKKEGGKESHEPELHINYDSNRIHFHGDFAPAMDIGGYLMLTNARMDDEIRFLTFGGKHDRDDPKLARCYVTEFSFQGSEVRSSTEHEHYGGGDYMIIDKNQIDPASIGGALLDRWVGVRFIGINSQDGDKTKTRLMMFVDKDGLKEGDKPANSWVKVADWTDDGTKYLEATEAWVISDKPLNNPPPYGKYPFDHSKAQQTISVDHVDVEGKHYWCREIDHTKPLRPDLAN